MCLQICNHSVTSVLGKKTDSQHDTWAAAAHAASASNNTGNRDSSSIASPEHDLILLTATLTAIMQANASTNMQEPVNCTTYRCGIQHTHSIHTDKHLCNCTCTVPRALQLLATTREQQAAGARSAQHQEIIIDLVSKFFAKILCQTAGSCCTQAATMGCTQPIQLAGAPLT